MLSNLLNGKTAVVTGCAGGLGFEIARVLASNGANIVAMDLSSEAVNSAVARLESATRSVKIFGVAVDVASSDSVSSSFQHIDEEIQCIDILVNCAGVREVKSVLHIEPREWDRVIGINLNGPFYCSQQAAIRMVKTGGGSIVNIASVAASFGMPHRPAYNASKTGLIGLTRNLSKDLAPFGIRVNAVAPGLMRTSLTETYFDDEKFVEGLTQVVPLGAGGTAEDVANAVLFLCTSQSKFITGVMLPVDGGWSAEKGYTTGNGSTAYTNSAAST